MKRRKRRLRKKLRVPKTCFFCESNIEPSYKDEATLSRLFTGRGKILGKRKTGICSKHQRRFTQEAKRARYLGILPFVIKPH